MGHFIEEKLNTPVCGDYDVIVAGGGPAGIGAAIAAARNGMKTLVVERYGCLGGIWTAGLVNPFFDTEHKGGLVKELVDSLRNDDAWGGWNGICFDYETIKVTLDDMVVDAGADILLQSYISGTIVESNVVKGIIVENKSGRQAYTAKVVIDCSGDGDVAAMAGAEYEFGRKEDGQIQPMTLMYKLGNIYFPQQTPSDVYNLMQRAVKDNNLEYTPSYKFPYILTLPDQKSAAVQMVHINGASALNVNDITQAYLKARKEVMEAFKVLKGYVPQFKDITLEQTAMQMGVREARRITGEYVLTLEDMLEGRRFEDGITICGFPVDIHAPDGKEQVVSHVQPYHIPYRSLVPLKLEGLLVAGRCISGTHEAHASYRVTGNCMAMGEAAGTAAAIAVRSNKAPRYIDTKTLVNKLIEQGVLL